MKAAIYLTKQEAADRLSISMRTLEGLISRGALPAYRIGPRLVRIKEQDLEDYVSGRLVAPGAVRKTESSAIQRPCRYVPGMKVV